MTLAALVCLGIGFFPNLLYDLLPYEFDYWPYDMTHVLTQLQLLAFAILGVVFLHRSGWYPAEIPSVNLDAEWLWRRLLPGAARRVTSILGALSRAGRGAIDALLQGGLYLTSKRQLQSTLARDWPTGSMVFWVGVFLAILLLAEMLSSWVS